MAIRKVRTTTTITDLPESAERRGNPLWIRLLGFIAFLMILFGLLSSASK